MQIRLNHIAAGLLAALVIVAPISLPFLVGGCATTQTVVTNQVVNADGSTGINVNVVSKVDVAATIENNLGIIQGASEAACLGVLQYAVSDSDRGVKAKCLWGIAACVRSTAQGTLPTPAQLNETLKAAAINDGTQWVGLAATVQAIYAPYYNKIVSNNLDIKLGLEVLTAIAGGIEAAAETVKMD